VEFIAFIDDDEVPIPTWLNELLNVQRLYEADIVSGPVLPQFEIQPPPWILQGGFFELPRYPTGHPITYVPAGNVLVRSRVFKEMGEGFNEHMALTGGSDTHFFLRARRAGYKMVFANKAIVYEWNPPSRVSMRWILQRAYRVGNSFAFSKMDLDPSIKTYILLLAEAGRAILLAVWTIRLLLILDKPAAVESLRHILQGVGIILGLAGHRYEEYRRPHVE
jgi:GT2 family glycosyltransferase